VPLVVIQGGRRAIGGGRVRAVTDEWRRENERERRRACGREKERERRRACGREREREGRVSGVVNLNLRARVSLS